MASNWSSNSAARVRSSIDTPSIFGAIATSTETVPAWMAVSTPNRPSASITATVIVVKSMALIPATSGGPAQTIANDGIAILRSCAITSKGAAPCCLRRLAAADKGSARPKASGRRPRAPGGDPTAKFDRQRRQGARAVSMSADRSGNWWSKGAGALAARAALLGVAGLAGWLAATPAATQPAQPEGATGAIRGAGKSATPPSADRTDRNELLIVGSTSMRAITDAVIERLMRDYLIPQPIVQPTGSETGFEDFCAGVGASFPDIAAASHRMSRGDYDTCVENKVLDIIEVGVGQSAVVVATKKGNPVFDVTPRMIYYAVAEEIPIGGEFTANPYKNWKETDKAAPDLPIRVLIPAQGSGTRSFFNDSFMQGGCRHVKEIDAIFAAADRVPRCITVRDDGPVTELEEPFEKKALAALATV